MSKFDKEVQGTALYLEFRRAGSTCQIVITPEGFADTNDYTGIAAPIFFRRTITDGVTKRKWRAYGLGRSAELSEHLLTSEEGNDMNEETLKTVTERRLSQLSDYFDSLVRNRYTLVNDTPIYVEVTKMDLIDAKNLSLSTKLWTRIKASRAALGFPENIIDPYPTTSI